MEILADKIVLLRAVVLALSETREVPRMDPSCKPLVLVGREDEKRLQETVQNVGLVFGQGEQDKDLPDDA